MGHLQFVSLRADLQLFVRMSIQGGNDTEVQGQVVEEEEEEPVAAGGVGFGPGLIPPHATWSQPCCMCPLYDEETGEIEGWIGDAPQNPRSAAVTYIVVAQAVAERQEKVSFNAPSLLSRACFARCLRAASFHPSAYWLLSLSSPRICLHRCFVFYPATFLYYTMFLHVASFHLFV